MIIFCTIINVLVYLSLKCIYRKEDNTRVGVPLWVILLLVITIPFIEPLYIVLTFIAFWFAIAFIVGVLIEDVEDYYFKLPASLQFLNKQI